MNKAIIVAAGMGNRLRPLTDDRPKCLLSVGGMTMLDRAVGTMRTAGVKEISVVRGYQAEKINLPGLRFFNNPNYVSNNILHSLFCAEAAMEGGFIFSYADIVYTPTVLDALLASPADIAVVVDRDWKRAYDGRHLNMEDEAEVVVDDSTGIHLIGKGAVSPGEATGEFIGMAKFSVAGASRLCVEFDRLRTEFAGRYDQPFQRAKEFQKAYMTDMFQELIGRGIHVEAVPIFGGWREVDTPQDLERADALFAPARV